MAFDSTATVELIGVIGGQTAYTVLYYFADANYSSIPSSAVAEAAEASIWPELKALVVNDFRMLTIRGRYSQRSPLLIKPAYEISVDESGDVTTTEALPGYVTVNGLLIPDLDTYFPNTNVAPGLGWRGFSGAPEAAQSNGLLTDAALADWRAFMEAIETLEVDDGGTPRTYSLGNYRSAAQAIDPDTEATYSYTLETDVSQKTGIRKSRKRV